MDTTRKLFEILGDRKPLYLLAGVMLIVSIGIRMLEPRILEIAIDDVILFNVAKDNADLTDSVAGFLRNLLPATDASNLATMLWWLGLVFVVIALLRGALMFGATAITASSSEKAIKRLRDRLFNHIQLLPLSFHAQNKTGDLIQRCTGDVDTVRQFVLTQVVDVIRLTAMFVAAFAMMLSIHLWYGLAATVMAPIIAWWAYRFSLVENKVWEEHENERDKLSSMVQENLSGIRVVKAFAREGAEINNFEQQNIRTRDVGIKHVMLHARFWPGSDMLLLLQMSLTLLLGAWLTINGSLTLGEFSAFYAYAWMIAWPLRRVGRIVSQMSMATVAIERLSNILGTPIETYKGDRSSDGRLRGEIEFRDVSFAYDDAPDQHVVHKLSFHVKPGETIGLVGPTGAGKSTIIALLTRMHEPTSGEIFVDGRNLRDYDKEWLRERIGVVLQNPFLFSTTIRENIAYARPGARQDDVIRAARDAHIHDIVNIFPEGYDTVVGEKGVTLSGGQKQRVTLARTILREPDILVLDDATSAVDFYTEFGIQRALRRRSSEKTSFVIAHRLSSVREADRIFVLNKGTIVDQGTHEELRRRDGFYKVIHDIQMNVEAHID